MTHFKHHSEENYLKMLYKLSSQHKRVNNTALSKALQLNPATVLEMVRKLSAKGLLETGADKAIQLTEKGRKRALLTIRKHRLWEVFLVNKLGYSWNEVHDLAEQLEHVESASLTDRLEQFLGNPSFDPHGDPIPDRQGRIKPNPSVPLSTGEKGQTYQVVSLAETQDAFLDYLGKLGILPGTRIRLVEQNAYDQSWTVSVKRKDIQLSDKVATNILVQAV
jgi:DtxR family Mn-dependent transcriptional regulator